MEKLGIIQAVHDLADSENDGKQFSDRVDICPECQKEIRLKNREKENTIQEG
jgi:uncharacterized protein with PIN domain